MATEVTKKDGNKELFSAEKIMDSITAAVRDAKLSDELGDAIIEEVSDTAIEFAKAKESVTTSEIKEKILAELDRLEPSVSAAWRAYDAKKGE